MDDTLATASQKAKKRELNGKSVYLLYELSSELLVHRYCTLQWAMEVRKEMTFICHLLDPCHLLFFIVESLMELNSPML